ncbi:hypothetical protein [Clostridium felsineum]|uniref:Uncharacterized protein n=1 Tax=Clostridium felsineum TaxID=36839 RepID=A0A1S8KYJ8_9CLOT|nr:hypothetical protein [Clostridium felsineum]URZ07872.1 hypothetical protein CLROS_032330 [Clostridium felsineum]URZ12903.1 hypothetical protein CROST_036480 [Clostridium felsineum]
MEQRLNKTKSINTKKIILLLIIPIAFIITSVLPVKIPEKVAGDFNKNRLLVEEQFITGPPYRIIKGHSSVSKLFKGRAKIDTSELGLTGNIPLNSIDINALRDENLRYIIEGKIVGTTDIYGDGYKVPIFHVTSWHPTSYLSCFYYGKSKTFIITWLILGCLFILEIIVLLIRLILKYLIKKFR